MIIYNLRITDVRRIVIHFNMKRTVTVNAMMMIHMPFSSTDPRARLARSATLGQSHDFLTFAVKNFLQQKKARTQASPKTTVQQLFQNGVTCGGQKATIIFIITHGDFTLQFEEQ